MSISYWSSEVCSSDLDHIMVGHDQEAPVEDPLLAGEHARHRRLHIVVDAAARHAAEEGKAARMRVEQHLLALAWIRPDIDRPRCTQPHMRNLHAHRLAGDQLGRASCRARVCQYV